MRTHNMIYYDDSLLSITENYLIGADYAHGYCKQVRSRISHFVRTTAISHAKALRPEVVNHYLAGLQSSGKLSPFTVRGYRTNIITIWMHAAELGLCDWPPRRLRTIKAKLAPVECWTLQELRQLVEFGASANDSADGMKYRDWWPALIHVGYATALRSGDLLRFTWQEIADDGTLIREQRKVGTPVAVRIPTYALALAAGIRIDDRVLPWPFSHELLRKRFKALTKASPVPAGTLKRLRISAITHAEAARPGWGKRIAGHSTEQITQRHYTARAILATAPAEAPPLGCDP